jgi:hypothetical protein
MLFINERSSMALKRGIGLVWANIFCLFIYLFLVSSLSVVTTTHNIIVVLSCLVGFPLS